MNRKVVSILLAMLLVISVFSGCRIENDSNIADTAIIGTVYTADENDSIVQAVAIKEGTYQYVGDEDGIKKYIGDKTEVIKLGKGMAMPTFFEGHAHGHQGGVGKLFEVALYDGVSMDDYAKAIADFIEKHPDIKFLKGGGWINGYCPPGGPSKEVLDEITVEIPIMLDSADHHSLWVNSKAMELAGVTADTPDVAGGVIERDPSTKEPTGTFRENARVLFKGTIPDYSVEQYKEGILAYQDEVKAYGITSFFEPMVNLGGGKNLLKAYNELDKEGKLNMKVFGGYQVMPDQNPLSEVDQCLALKKEAKGGNFEITAIKLLVDGVVEGKTAYLLEDYASDPGFRGSPLWDQDLLNEVCAKADKLGLQIHTHAIGDAAVKMTLDAYEYVAEKNGTTNNRHAITHLQIVDPADIKRMAELNVIASTNPYWFCKEPGYFYELEAPYLGEGRANREYPMKSFFDAGVVVTAASDYPVTIPSMPLDAIQKGVTRCSLEGDPSTLLNADERASLLQMLRATTINGAYQNFAENSLGSVEVGKSADIIILDQNLFVLNPDKIINTNVLKTFFQGKVVYNMK